MKKEEFLSFLQTSLDELANQQRDKSYDEMHVDFGDTSQPEEEFEEEDDYFYEPEEDTDEYGGNDAPVDTTDFSAGSKSFDNTSLNFTQDLMENLIKKFKPRQEVRDEVFSTRQGFEDIPTEQNTITFCGSPFKYTRYEKPLEVPEDLVVNQGASLEDSLSSFREILDYVMFEIERIYGGFDRITDLAVVSGIVIINGVSFEPMLKDNLIMSLPVDLQYSVRNGCFAYMLDYWYLREFKNLANLKVDDVDFLFSKIRVDLDKGRNFEPKDLFNICKKLNTLQVGEYVITRKNVDVCDDVFHRVRKSTEIADKLESLGFAGTKASWGCVRDIFMNNESKKLWKGIKLATMVGVASATTVATVGFKLTRTLGQLGKKAVLGAGSVIEAVKENL